MVGEMDTQEAHTVLTEQLLPYRGEGYKALQRLLAEPDIFAIRGPSGSAYRLQIEAVWDDRPGGALRVFGLIEDGERLGAFAPITGEFTVASTGAITG
jgi:hypothetical protein